MTNYNSILSSSLPFRLSRSELEQFLNCPYSGYLASLTPGPQNGTPFGVPPAGVQRRSKASSLIIGGAIHKGWEPLLQALKAGGPLSPELEDEAAKAAIDYVKGSEMSHDHNQRLVTDFEWKESIALAEGLIRISARMVVPHLAEIFEVVEVERELTAELAKDEFEFPSRVDAILRRRDDGALGVLSLKTSKYIEIPGQTTKTGRKIQDYHRIDMQGASEMWNARQNGFDVDFVQFVTLRKGEPRLHDTKELRSTGQEPFMYYNLPLLTGWKKETGLDSPDYFWAWDFIKGVDDEGKPQASTLSWRHHRRFWVFEEMLMKEWLNLLQGDWVFPPRHQTLDNRSALDNLYQISLPIYRSPLDIEEWRVQTLGMFERIQEAWFSVKDENPDENQGLLRILYEFPRNRSRCLFPSTCEFFNHCHEGSPVGGSMEYLDSLEFIPRVENHPRELSESQTEEDN